MPQTSNALNDAGTAQVADALHAGQFRNPAISLSGTVDDKMYREFRERFAAAPDA